MTARRHGKERHAGCDTTLTARQGPEPHNGPHSMAPAASAALDEGSDSDESEDPMAALLGQLASSESALNRKRKPSSTIGELEENHPDEKRPRHSEPAQDHEVVENLDVVDGCLPDSAETSTDWSTSIPVEIWHHVFTFLEPRILGYLLRVNSVFYRSLQPSHTDKLSSLSTPAAENVLSGTATSERFHGSKSPALALSPTSCLSTLDANVIWRLSRQRFWPRMPAPLHHRSELDMWRFCRTKLCQYCPANVFEANDFIAENTEAFGPSRNVNQAADDDSSHSVSRAKGALHIFSFFSVSCSDCLQRESVKEIDLLLSSSTPSALLPGLPFVLLTPQFQVISPTALRSMSSADMQLTKRFWPSQIKEMKREFEEVKSRGAAAAEEWIEGLELRGKNTMANVSRWDQWLLSGGLEELQKALGTPETRSTIPEPHCGSGGSSVNASPRDPATVVAESLSLPDSSAQPVSHQRRSKTEVAALKASRKADIERRASLLRPPIIPALLIHMPSFQAALQLVTPLDDSAWELLKPRLLGQKEVALRKLKESIAAESRRGAATGAQTAPSGQPGRDIPDSEWDQKQGPLRARIARIADEVISTEWEDGDRVRKKTAAQFATQVLLHVREQFYLEIAAEDAASIAAGKEPIVDPPEGPWIHRLTLENMKWVFDFKIRPLTEKHGKELFICNGCKGGRSYGLEAVIQHYAAKHTKALSVGSIVVHWRAAWPEEPIIFPDPKNAPPYPVEETYLANASHKCLPQPGDGSTHGGSSHHSQNGYNGLQPFGFFDSSFPPYNVPSTSRLAYHPYPSIHGPPNDSQMLPYASYANYEWHSDGQFAPPSHGSYPQQSFQQPSMPHQGSFLSSQNSQQHRLDQSSHVEIPSVKSSVQIDSEMQHIGKVVQQTWNQINIARVAHRIKVYVVMQQARRKFKKRFSRELTLEIWLKATALCKEFMPLKRARRLLCKICDHDGLPATRKQGLDFLKLMDHLRQVHPDRLNSSTWVQDLIQVPEDETSIKNLKEALGKNRPARKTVVDTMPQVYGRRLKSSKHGASTSSNFGSFTSTDSASEMTQIKREEASPRPISALSQLTEREEGSASEDEQAYRRPFPGSQTEPDDQKKNLRPHAPAHDIRSAETFLLSKYPRQAEGAAQSFSENMYDDFPSQDSLTIDPEDTEPRVPHLLRQTSSNLTQPFEDGRAHASLSTHSGRNISSDQHKPRPSQVASQELPDRRDILYANAAMSQRSFEFVNTPHGLGYEEEYARFRNPSRLIQESRTAAAQPHFLEDSRYEIVEVRDPSGSYYVRRPVRDAIRDVRFRYDDGRPVADQEYRQQYDKRQKPAAAQHHDGRGPSHMRFEPSDRGQLYAQEQQSPRGYGNEMQLSQGSGSQFEDYDPKFPSGQDREPRRQYEEAQFDTLEY